MLQVSEEELARDVHGYVARAKEGEVIVVTHNSVPVVELKTVERASSTLRPIGLAKGQFVVPDDFNDPLPDELLDLFEGR